MKSREKAPRAHAETTANQDPLLEVWRLAELLL